MELRDALRLLRSETGLTQVELADYLNVGFSTVSRWENQNTRPNKAAAVAIMKLARERHVSSICLDELGRILLAPRVDDKEEREAAEKIAEQMKLEQRLLLTSEQLKTTIDNIDVGIIAQRFFSAPAGKIEVFYYNSFFADTLGYTAAEFSEKLKRNLYFTIMPEYRRDFAQKIQDLISHKIELNDFTTIIRMMRKDGVMMWGEVKAISLHEFSFGQELFTACRDVTEREESKRAFQKEVAYREVSLKNCYATFHCDLSANKILRERDASALTGSSEVIKKADIMLRTIASAAPKGADREMFIRIFDREAMLEAFSQGETSQSLFLYNNVGRRWLRMEYHLVNNPANDHVEALIYSYDIQKQVLSMKMMDTITKYFFDYVGYIDIESGIYETLYTSDKSVKQSFALKGSYMEALEWQKDRYAVPDKGEDDLKAMSLETVIKKLSERAFYSHKHGIRDDGGNIIEKKTIFTYLDETRRQIVAAQCDARVTEELFKKLLQNGNDENESRYA